MDTMDNSRNSRVPGWLMQTVAVLLGIALIAITANQFVGARNGARQVNSDHTINISAVGKVTAAPDTATVNAGIQAQGNTSSEAQAKVSANANKATEYLKNQGIKIENIRTENYNIYPNYDYSTPGRSNVITGYTANETLVIKINDLSKVGTLLDGLTKNGVELINNVVYSFEDPDNFRNQAREEALKNAKEKAENLARAAGLKLGKLVSFSEINNSGYPVPMYAEKSSNMAMGGDAAMSQLPAGQQDITAEISVTYEIVR